MHKKKVDSVSHDLKIVKIAVFGLSSSNLRFIVFLDKYFSTFQLTFFSVIEKVFMHKFADDLEPESCCRLFHQKDSQSGQVSCDSQQIFSCPKSTIETLEKGMKYVQS